MLFFSRKPLKLYFSAPVDKKGSKVQLLKDKKKLRCHFPKSTCGVFGQACIKRLPIMDFSALPKWTSKEDLRYALWTVIYFTCSKIEIFVVIPEVFKYNRTRLVKRRSFTHKLFLAHRQLPKVPSPFNY